MITSNCAADYFDSCQLQSLSCTKVWRYSSYIFLCWNICVTIYWIVFTFPTLWFNKITEECSDNRHFSWKTLFPQNKKAKCPTETLNWILVGLQHKYLSLKALPSFWKNWWKIPFPSLVSISSLKRRYISYKILWCDFFLL